MRELKKVHEKERKSFLELSYFLNVKYNIKINRRKQLQRYQSIKKIFYIRLSEDEKMNRARKEK